MNAEKQRLEEDNQRIRNWKRWGTYLSERQWGTVREDYSANSDSWNHFPHEQARSRAYRWGEDGLLGITDRECRLCFAPALWNGKDPILKERLFGLTGPEGNHGEDCKELYYYLDSTPTHSYQKALYKYPQDEYPYEKLKAENQNRGLNQPEYEILDTGIFDENKYFDFFVEYAKENSDNILIKFTIQNHSSEEAELHVLPTLWFRNTWIWGCEYEGCTLKPRITKKENLIFETNHQTLESFCLAADPTNGELIQTLFTENETNTQKLYGKESYTKYFKDAFHEYLIAGKVDSINPANIGTKAAFHYHCKFKPKEIITLRFRLYSGADENDELFGGQFDEIFELRKKEAYQFYDSISVGELESHSNPLDSFQKSKNKLSDDQKLIQRQAYAGLLWSKQFYHYSVRDWLKGDETIMPAPLSRYKGRNASWTHLFNKDIISMPDKWEYPWYAAWDLAFHMIPFATLDPKFAKDQLLLMLREWYMHPNGQIPAYEYSFDDVNPPVHAWACWRVYKMAGSKEERDIQFLSKAFHKLLINFTWWVNRKDPDGNNVFAGGFLGLDNIGVFDRSASFPEEAIMEQADGTAWMAFYCLTMLAISIELALHDSSYEDVASKFFEHFIAIVDSMNKMGNQHSLWDEEDGFYYDRVNLRNGNSISFKIRSMVGLIPLFAVEIIDESTMKLLPNFRKRVEWFLNYRKDLQEHVSIMQCNEGDKLNYYLLALPSKDKLQRVLKYLCDEKEFLSDYGIRALSKAYEKDPYTFRYNGFESTIKYLPAESDSRMFGGNSNWRGPIWFPVNYLLVESLEKYFHFYRNDLKLEYPLGSGQEKNLAEISQDISKRLIHIFEIDNTGVRAFHRDQNIYSKDSAFKDLILYYEYFHGDNGRGVGASHQTGWTALVAKLVEDLN